MLNQPWITVKMQCHGSAKSITEILIRLLSLAFRVEISKLWAAFIPYSHYDGVIETWSYSACDRASALTRLNRLKNRPQFICHEATNNQQIGLNATKYYLDSTGIQAPLTLRETGFRNHNDAWLLRPSLSRSKLRKWLGNSLVK